MTPTNTSNATLYNSVLCSWRQELPHMEAMIATTIQMATVQSMLITNMIIQTRLPKVKTGQGCLEVSSAI
ncbi:hypothetical protein C0J52_23954 [Blattella germanica]|nr:hypothetical protein C0J52_23954 [Blattella germanica]